MLTDFEDLFPFNFALKFFSLMSYVTFFYYFIMLALRMELITISLS